MNKKVHIFKSSTCCSHLTRGGDITDAANRRLFEEMVMRCKLSKLFSFIYTNKVENSMIVHELDNVFVGTTYDLPESDRMEVAGWKYPDF